MNDKLLNRLTQGDVQIFEDIYRAYHVRVYHFVLRYTQDSEAALELTQMAFIQLWDKRSNLSLDKSFESQFFGMVRNLSIDAMRKQVRYLNLRHAYKDTYKETEATTDRLVAHSELSEHLESAIQRLPEKRQEIFRLNRQMGLTYAEIARRLSISTKTVETQMSKALKFLREELSGFLTLFL